MKVDYSQGKIYKITNDYNNDIYVGSTCDTLVKRFSYHKKDMSHEKKFHLPLYKLMSEIGFDRFRIELIENFPSQDKYELRQKEGHYIRQLGTLNKVIAGRDYQEWYKQYKTDNNEKISGVKHDYYIKNKSELNSKNKDYYKQKQRRNKCKKKY